MTDPVGGLLGRNALVTGGGTGIGFGCAHELLAAGANVTTAGRREAVLVDAVDRLGAEDTSGSVQDAVCDITSEPDVAAAVDHAALGGNLDVLVANAGSGYPAAILQADAEVWNFCFNLNMTGTALSASSTPER